MSSHHSDHMLQRSQVSRMSMSGVLKINLLLSLSVFSENLKFFWKSENFSENLIFFRKSDFFPKIWFFPENLDFFPKIWFFSENLIFSKNLKFSQKYNFFSRKFEIFSKSLIFFSKDLIFFLKIWKFSENLKKKNLSLWSNVSMVTCLHDGSLMSNLSKMIMDKLAEEGGTEKCST